MLTLPEFELHRPESIDAALALLAEHRDECRLLAGGTDLLVNLRMRADRAAHVVSLAGLDELRRVEIDACGELRLGALVTIDALSRDGAIPTRFPVIAQAAAVVSSPTLRAMGTLGGNLCLDTRCHWINQSEEWRRACGFCLKKDGDVCHVARGSSTCLAAYSGDLAPALIALDADVTLRSAEGERTVPLDAFFVDDGGQRTVRHADELLTQIRVPAHRANLGGSYGKLRGRNAIDFPLAGVAVAGRIDDDGRFRDIAIALTATAPRPIRVPAVREMLEGEPADDALIEAAAERVARAAKPLETSTCFSPSYRRHRVRLLARDGLRAL